MAITQKCTFCGTNISQGTGKLFVRKDAKMVWLCSNKCEKNLNKLGRKPRETAWTGAYATEKKTRLTAAAHAAESKAEGAKEAPAPSAKKAAAKTATKTTSKTVAKK